jgi:septal ring factor EnvC (AmiA/AmiB activator)
MKDKAPIIVLILVAAGLGFALIVVNNKAHRENQELSDALSVQSNTVTSIKASLNEQQAVNQTLETNLAATRVDYSNKLAVSDATLRATVENLEKAKAEAKAKADADAAEINERDKKIADVESRNLDLDKQANDLREHIAGLQTQINATQEKLANSEGDRGVLLKEMKRLQAEKTAWENRFNDLVVLQAQVRKLKNDLAEARMLDWMRRGVYANARMKGGERLITPPVNSTSEPVPTLQVELHQGGHTNVMITPLPGDAAPK